MFFCRIYQHRAFAGCSTDMFEIVPSQRVKSKHSISISIEGMTTTMAASESTHGLTISRSSCGCGTFGWMIVRMDRIWIKFACENSTDPAAITNIFCKHVNEWYVAGLKNACANALRLEHKRTWEHQNCSLSVNLNSSLNLVLKIHVLLSYLPASRVCGVLHWHVWICPLTKSKIQALYFNINQGDEYNHGCFGIHSWLDDIPLELWLRNVWMNDRSYRWKQY